MKFLNYLEIFEKLKKRNFFSFKFFENSFDLSVAIALLRQYIETRERCVAVKWLNITNIGTQPIHHFHFVNSIN